MSEENIEIFVERAKAGDHEAFAKIYDNLIDPIYRYVYYRVRSADAEDLVETVFLKVWENLKQYKKQKSSFSSWVFRIAHNLVVDYYRAHKDQLFQQLNPQIPDQDRLHNPIRNAVNALDKDILKKAIVCLKIKYQEIIIYKFVNDLSNKEIAEIMGKSEGSLRILQYRALQALKRELEKFNMEY